MENFFRELRGLIYGPINIRRRLFRLLLICSLLSAIVFAGFSIYSIVFVRNDVADMGERLSSAGAEYTRRYIDKTSKYTLLELVKAQAGYIDRELELMKHDVYILSENLSWMKQNPERYIKGKVYDPYEQKVPSAEPYIIYSPELRRRGIETVREEVALLANMRDTLVPIERTYGTTIYSAAYFGSKDGFLICSSVFPGDEYSPISNDTDFDYDPRVRPWYTNAVEAGGEVFSLPYTTILTEEYDDVEVISCSAPYYDSAGIAGVASLDMSTEILRKLVSNTIIGEKGINFVMTDQGKIVFSSVNDGVLAETGDNQDIRNDAVVKEAAVRMAKGESGILPVRIYGEEYMMAYAPIPTVGWSMGVLVLEDDISASVKESQTYFIGQMNDFKNTLENEYRFLLGLVILALVIMFMTIFFMSKRLSDRFVRPILKMSDGVREIASGNMDKKLDIKTGDELEHLAICFNAMTDELKIYMENLSNVTAEKERIATELSVASNIQMGALPQDFMEDNSKIQLYASMSAAKEVGGDFYDFYMLDEKHLVMTIADVSGKGVPAALFMMRAKTTLKNLMFMANSPDELGAVMTLANRELCTDNDGMMFVTVFLAQLDLVTGELVYVNGGHTPPLISRNGNFSYLRDDKKYLMLGALEYESYEPYRLHLSKGDMLFLHTDGVTEAMNNEGNLYSEERLQETLNGIKGKHSVHEILEAVQSDVDSHADGAAQSDDLTMLGVRFLGAN